MDCSLYLWIPVGKNSGLVEIKQSKIGWEI